LVDRAPTPAEHTHCDRSVSNASRFFGRRVQRVTAAAELLWVHRSERDGRQECLLSTHNPDQWSSIMPANPLSLREREEIRYAIARGETVTAAADRLGRHRCTISAEISRNGGRDHYRAYRAHDQAASRRSRPKIRVFDRSPELAAHVIQRLEAKDSPMTIAVELANGVYPNIDETVSHETIYTAVYDPCRSLPRGLYRCLHRRRRLRSPRSGRRPQDRWRADLPSISTRPAIAGERHEVGHLEGDLIIGERNQSAIITVFDRTSRHLWMAGLPNGHAAGPTLTGLTKLLKRIPPELRHTLTWDQGGEMASHEQLAKRCRIDIYFADPRSPWQRPDGCGYSVEAEEFRYSLLEFE